MIVIASLFLCTLCCTVAAHAAGWRSTQDPAVNRLVDELMSLSPNATRSEFLSRPAMSQLMALGPAGYPALREVFLKDSNWAVQASVGYLVITMARISDSEVNARVHSLMNGDNAFVRATVGTLCKRWAPLSHLEVLVKPEVNAIAARLRLDSSLDWMAPADLSKLAANSLSVIDMGRPFLEPPAWDGAGARTWDGDVSLIRSAGLRAVTLEHAMAEGVFASISDSLVLSSTDVHGALELLLASLEADGGSDQERLARKFRMTELMLDHQNNECSGGKCKVRSACKVRLLEACDKWVWTATDPNALYAVQSALTSIIRLDKAKSLLERMKERHPNPELREMTGRNLGYYAEQLAGEERERERLRLHWERIEREKQERVLDRQEKPAYKPDGVSIQEPDKRGPWILVGAIGVAVLMAAGAYYKTRK